MFILSYFEDKTHDSSKARHCTAQCGMRQGNAEATEALLILILIQLQQKRFCFLHQGQFSTGFFYFPTSVSAAADGAFTSEKISKSYTLPLRSSSRSKLDGLLGGGQATQNETPGKRGAPIYLTWVILSNHHSSQTARHAFSVFFFSILVGQPPFPVGQPGQYR